MNPSLLQEIGLTEGEAKVYLAMLRTGTTKTGHLAKEAQVSSSKVYKILDRLMSKGLAGYVTRGKTKYFTAMEPNRIIDYMEEREKELQEKKTLVMKIIPQLELEKKISKESEAVIYEGFKAVTNFFRNIINELESGETYYVLGAGYGDTPGLRPFFYNHHTRRVKKGIRLMMLAEEQIKNNIEPTTKQNSEIRYLPKHLMSNMQITFYKNKTFITLFTKFPIGFLITGEETMNSFKTYFDTFWKNAKS